MKKLILLISLGIFLSVMPILANETCEEALNESTLLLESALEKINEQFATLEEQAERIEFLKSILEEADKALGESNNILQKSYERIADDSIEIANLRKTIAALINAGVEIKTYDWNVMVMSGYPFNLEVDVAYNLPFLTSIGVVVGINHNIDSNITSFQIGLKINIGKD